jgi:Restriction endonuclease fold toxin 5
VQQSRVFQAQSSLPDILGAGVTGGGVLALRQNQRRFALDAWQAKPTLRHPDAVLGKSDGGPGQWTLSGPRPKGADYQEQVSGVPRGIEYEVAGIKFDHYDAKRNVLVDAKDWGGYVLPEAKFWRDEVLGTAKGQLTAVGRAGAKATVEWHVTTPEAANAIRNTLKDGGLTQVTVVLIPKKGP